MKTPLAWLNLLHDKTRASVAVAGVAFAVVLVLMQLGFLGAARRTATQVYEQLDFDLLLVSRQYFYLSKAGTFPRARLYQALSAQGVAGAKPLYVGFNYWLNGKQNVRPDRERNDDKLYRRGIFVIGLRPENEIFRLGKVREQLPLLQQPGHVLMDTFSRKKFFGAEWEHNDDLEIGGRHIKVVGTFAMGTGFGADGDVIVSDQTFGELFPDRSEHEVSLGLLKLAPGAKADEVAARLEQALLPDVRVLTRDQITKREQDYWVERTSVGVIFKLGVLVGFIVGTAIVYQVLSSDIANHMPEYATLKAMGYGPRYLAGVVLQQAWILSLVGFVPGWIISKLLYDLTRNGLKIPLLLDIDGTHLPMVLDWPLTWQVALMSVAMCSLSGLAALRKVNSADPADLF
ncbi:MAG TPA: ABC transporter permease DevC [Pirellulales bacterium]|nr:ABC transporter permease DevC [Pirellulales bacterium]